MGLCRVGPCLSLTRQDLKRAQISKHGYNFLHMITATKGVLETTKKLFRK